MRGLRACGREPRRVSESRIRRAIARKRDGEDLEPATWHSLIGEYLAGSVDDAQLAALLMACVLRGMSAVETQALTAAFVESGETLEAPDPRTVDKHSSGGVADTASLIVVPMVAACGVPVAKLSGRALGHTGGTLDKLEAIEGVRTDLAPERFFACVREAGCAISAQSERLVPADKRIYALRDRTATVPSPGLIAASIVSKKIAGGAHGIVFDVKSGSGAFVSATAEAQALAESLVSLTRAFGRRATALVTDMNEPLGLAIGTGLEAIEARDFLRGGRRDPRLGAVCEALGLAMLGVSGFEGDAAAALHAALESGAAYETFTRMLSLQGARAGALEAMRPHAERSVIAAAQTGFVAAIDPVMLGEAARELVARSGATAGIELCVRAGASVRAGAPLAIVYGSALAPLELEGAFRISEAAPAPRPVIYREVVSASLGGADSIGAPRSTLESR